MHSYFVFKNDNASTKIRLNQHIKKKNTINKQKH